MKVVDLSHTISEGMPVYPGTDTPAIFGTSTIKEHGFVEKKITLNSHTGTHVDAPAHVIHGAPSADLLSPMHFIGKASLLDLSHIKKPEISLEDLSPLRQVIEKRDFIIIHTGYYRLWGQDSYFQDYPVLSMDSAKWLARHRLKGVGMDTISMDKPGSVDLPVHHIFLERDVIIIENLTNLEALGDREFLFFCLPLKIDNADGSPVRAIALLDHD